MSVDVTKILKEALSKLTAEKRRIERQPAAIQDALRAVNGAQLSSTVRAVTRGTKLQRRRMGAATRKAISDCHGVMQCP
jgi:hypothetical protein